MADYVTAIRTVDGDKPIDYEALAKKPKINGKEMISNVILSIEDLESNGKAGQLIGFTEDNVVGAIDMPKVVAVWG